MSGWVSALCLCGSLLAGAAWADCEPQPKADEAGFSVCKTWPAYPDLTLSAVANFTGDSAIKNADRIGSYDLGLSVFSAGAAVPMATYYKSAAFQVDAIALQDLQFDTARYTLTSELRAFGVRVQFKGSSRVNPMDETWLSLYVKEGDNVRPVLDRLVMYRYGGEWDGNCAGNRFEITRTVEVGKTSSHGYADLIVRGLQTNTTGVGAGDACESNTLKVKPVLTTLRYNGKNYVVPDALKGW